ncbi:MAG: hypothetical protein FXF54_00310 [Kosmotoga sp.]|nr:MAG: hypothetical protein FXF54_00310 [Kosmotoga sp.]
MKKLLLVLGVLVMAAMLLAAPYEYTDATPTTERDWETFNASGTVFEYTASMTFILLPQVSVQYQNFDLGELCIENPDTWNDVAFYIDIKKNCPIQLNAMWHLYRVKDGVSFIEEQGNYYSLELVQVQTFDYVLGQGWTAGGVYDETTVDMPDSGPYKMDPSCYHRFWFSFDFSYDFSPCGNWCTFDIFRSAEYYFEVTYTILGEVDP